VAGLNYPEDVSERIFTLTQGHPTLVQRICREMVNIANEKHRRQMSMSDLDFIMENHIIRPQNGVCDVFWRQFCAEENLKDSIRDILAGNTPTNKKALFTLREHHFITSVNNQYCFRVPIFKLWLDRYAEVIE